MTNPKTILTGAAAIAALVKAERNDELDEYERVSIAGVPVFRRDAKGNPRVLGIPFGRWIRGPRR